MELMERMVPMMSLDWSGRCRDQVDPGFELQRRVFGDTVMASSALFRVHFMSLLSFLYCETIHTDW